MSGSNQLCKCDLKYDEFSVIDIKLLKQIKSVFAFASYDSKDIIFITSSDEVYGFGTNKYGRLGLGNSSPVDKPTIIPELCGKSIRKIEAGQFFMAAIDQFGHLYNWGADRERADYYSITYLKPNKVSVDNNMNTLADVKCCANRAVLLTTGGQIYTFGYNSFEQRYGTHTALSRSANLVTNLTNQIIIEISCGCRHSLALTSTGKVYAWGSNSYGQLGLGHTNEVTEPQLIQLSNIVTKLCSGDNYSHLMTPDGDFYSFGVNSSSQLGNEETTTRITPILVTPSERFVEIFAAGELSMGLCVTKNIVVWGKSKQRTISSLYRTRFHTFQEAIDFFCKDFFTYKSLSLKDIIIEKPLNGVIETMANAFNRPENSDLKFRVKREDSEEYDYIYGHKWFITATIDPFKRMYDQSWSETESNVITIDGYSYDSYYQFFRCLYTDSIESEDIEVLAEILLIANQYFNERVKAKCVECIKPLISVENVCSFYSSALRINSKELEEFCFKFMSTHISHITDTEDFDRMDGEDAKNFLKKHSKPN